MEQIFTYVVKEEIIRNVLKAHHNVLVVGWTGTGKTVSALKAVGVFDDVYYYNESGPGAAGLINQYNNAVKPLSDLSDFNNVKSEQPVLIIDDLETASDSLLEIVNGLVSGGPPNRKIMLIAISLVKVKDLLPGIEVVVRLKKETAEMIYTELLPQ